MSTNVKQKNNIGYIFKICSIAALGGILMGYDTGVISGAIGSIREYFQERPDSFLHLNLAANKSFASLLEFLEINPCATHIKEFPHLNKSAT